MRVKRFVPMVGIEDGRVRVFNPGPYAGLEVECLSLSMRDAYVPVVHRKDFLHLLQAFEERRVGPGEELLVVYDPLRPWIVGVFQPRLQIFVYPAGSLESLHEAMSTPGGGRQKFESLPRAIVEWRARH